MFIPLTYDPIISETLPIESIDKDQQLVDYLASVQNKDNIILGIHGYTHRSPISGKTICEYYCPNEEIPFEIVKERVDKGISIFKSIGLDTSWIVPPGMTYDDRFIKETKKLGYITEDYFFEDSDSFRNDLQMVTKSKNLGKIDKFKNKRDITSLTLGIKTSDGIMTPLIEKNTPIPTSKTKFFSTTSDNQQLVKIQILQEKGSMSADGQVLGILILDKIPPAPRGVPRIEVSFNIDANGILKVKAKDKATSQEKQITIRHSSASSYDTLFKEYTWGWKDKALSLNEYEGAKMSLAEDVKKSTNGLLLHIQDYNGQTETFIKEVLQKHKEIRFVRVDDVSSSDDLSHLEKLVNLASKNNRLLFIAVIPAHLSSLGSATLSPIIKSTWIIFIFFFLFPIAVMLPLHWYERRKVRRKKRLIPGSPKVSLIFPAYNEEKFIRKTIEQGLKQDYKGKIEIIIIDDGSTDKTFKIANDYTTCYQKKKKKQNISIKIYKHDTNLGKPAALNTGFKKATGKISIFSDSDSYLDSDLVSRMVPHFDNPRIGMVAGMIIIDNEINLLTKLQQIEYLYNQEIVRFCQETHKGVLICPGAATAVRTQIARDIPSTERTITEDADFTFEVAKAGWKVGQEPEAISRTDAPDSWKELINQRKRWLYGVLQTLWIHKWAIFFKDTKIPNLWVWWAWIGYITCPITTLVVLAIPLFLWLIGPSYLVFLGFYSLITGMIFIFAHWYGIKQYTHSNKVKLVIFLPIYAIYQYVLNVLLLYLVIAFVLRRGITVRYGGRNIHAV
ncbi:MAG: Hsp70 family protein [Candidatus Aenigmarchaeota archaeon]|nr:Hsp70 family protein [Candidatus Aenigmarchaeota archaeon]